MENSRIGLNGSQWQWRTSTFKKWYRVVSCISVRGVLGVESSTSKIVGMLWLNGSPTPLYLIFKLIWEAKHSPLFFLLTNSKHPEIFQPRDNHILIKSSTLAFSQCSAYLRSVSYLTHLISIEILFRQIFWIPILQLSKLRLRVF